MTIEQRRQQDDLVASIISKARENNKGSLLVGRTYDTVSVNSNAISIRVDFDYYSTTSSLVTCSLMGWSKEALKGKNAGQKVLVGYFGNFYAIIDVILE